MEKRGEDGGGKGGGGGRGGEREIDITTTSSPLQFVLAGVRLQTSLHSNMLHTRPSQYTPGLREDFMLTLTHPPPCSHLQHIAAINDPSLSIQEVPPHLFSEYRLYRPFQWM